MTNQFRNRPDFVAQRYFGQLGRVEMWRSGCRLNISVSASFVWRCLSGSALAPFSHPAHRTGHADFPHPACMGLSLSRGHHASFVIVCHSVLFVRPAPRAFFRPDRKFPSPSRAAVVKDGASFSGAEGLSLTDASTAAGCQRSAGWPRDDPRGACHWPRSIARTTLVFG